MGRATKKRLQWNKTAYFGGPGYPTTLNLDSSYGYDDRIAASYPDIFKAIKEAGVPVELHMFAGVGHGFSMQFNRPGVGVWPKLFRTWLLERGFLTKQ